LRDAATTAAAAAAEWLSADVRSPEAAVVPRVFLPPRLFAAAGGALVSGSAPRVAVLVLKVLPGTYVGAAADSTVEGTRPRLLAAAAAGGEDDEAAAEGSGHGADQKSLREASRASAAGMSGPAAKSGEVRRNSFSLAIMHSAIFNTVVQYIKV
jgi:hypothetical protein